MSSRSAAGLTAGCAAMSRMGYGGFETFVSA